MEYWESLVNTYEDSDDFRSFSKALQLAENVMKEDLAGFEIDWFLQTLLYKPINIINTIESKHRDDTWSKSIGDAYKLLADVVCKYAERVELWLVKIIELCSIPLDARTRTHSLHCLTACARTNTFSVYLQDTDGQDSRVRMYIAALEEGTSCKAPMAVFIGTICECHPEAVTDEVVRIWRIFLNMLESNKNTDTVINSVLVGIQGLLKHFGSELPSMEMKRFYEKLTTQYITISKCEKVILSIVSQHISLFKVFVCMSRGFRLTMWNLNDSMEAVMDVYKMIAQEMSKDEIRKILTQELLPQTLNRYALIKYTAFRLIKYIEELHNVESNIVYDFDVYTIEYELRNEVSYELAEVISFCIECNLPNSDRILQSAILFYENIPQNKRKTVVDGILNATPDMMMAYINTLITESCAPLCLEKHLRLWSDVLQTDDIARKRVFVEMFVKHLANIVDVFVNCDEDLKIPEKLQNLLILTSHVFTLHSPEFYTNVQCTIVLSKLVELVRLCGVEACLVAVFRSLILHIENTEILKEFYNLLSLEHCKDETLLCETCLAIIQSPDFACDRNTVTALQIIFSRKDAEPNMLIRALKKLENIILNHQDILEKNVLFEIINNIEKIRSRKDLSGKEARSLHREITIFVGKYSNNNNNKEKNKNLIIINHLTLDVPIVMESSHYKINVSRLLHLAIEHENEQSLMMLLTMVCAHDEINSPNYQHALGVLLCVCARVSVGVSVCLSAAHFVRRDALCTIVEHIVKECSPGVRKLLSDLIEGILLKETADEELLNILAEKVVLLMKSGDPKSKQAGLDITESLLQSLNENNILSKMVLLNILTTVAGTNQIDTYIVIDKVANLLLDKIELFEQNVIDDTVRNLFESVLKNDSFTKNDTVIKIYRNTLKSVLKFVKSLYEYKDEEPSKAVKIVFDICQSDVDAVKCLTVMSELTLTFDLEGMKQEIIESCDGQMLALLFSMDSIWVMDEFKMVGVLKFLTVFSDVLLKCHCQKTLQFLSELIKNLTPTTVIKLKRQLSNCLSKYKKLIDVRYLEVWTDGLPVKEITEYIDKNNYIEKHYSTAKALKILLDIFDLTNPNLKLTTLNIYATKWAKTLLRTYASGYIKHLKAEVSYLTDLMSVSLRFLTVTDVKRILKEGHGLKGVDNERVGLEFGKFFMTVFDKCLLSKPYVLLNEDMTDCCSLINELVKCCVRKRCSDACCDKLLELVDQLWPTYEKKVTNKQKHTLLLDMTFLPKKLPPESNPMQWVVSMICSENMSLDEKIGFIGILPGGDSYKEAYIHIVSHLPARLSELTGVTQAAFRAVMDSLSLTGDDTLLDIVINFIGGESVCGWWVSAAESCAATLALRPDVTRILETIYTRAWDGINTSVCTLLLVPLLRYSPSSTVTNFMSINLAAILCKLRTGQKLPSIHYSYVKCVADNIRAIDVLTVAFEKIPPQQIESPTSTLYKDIQTDKSWQLVRDVCKLCVTLRERVKSPDGASEELSKLVRTFQYSAYNCMCAGITLWKPDYKIYQTIIDHNVLEKVIDCNETYILPLKANWNHRKITKPVSVSITKSDSSTSGRTRMFMRTLSENPLLFDFINENSLDEVETSDIEVVENPLNCHPCTLSLTGVLRQLSADSEGRGARTVSVILNTGGNNVRWIIAQAICNSKEEMRPQASILAPALVAVISDTAILENGKKVLNDLHIDILNTLIQWGADSHLTESIKLNESVEYLITTCLVNSHRPSIYKTLLDVFGKITELYSIILKISWRVFEDFVKDTNKSKSTFSILQKLTKNNIYIPELMPNLISILTGNYQSYQLSKLAELFGLAIKCYEFNCETKNFDKSLNIDQYKVEFKKVLNKLRRTNVSDFIKLLHYSGCCDESQFRTIVDLTLKLPQSERNKCIDIMSTYISTHQTSDAIDEMPHDLREIVEQQSGERLFEDFFKNPRSSLEPEPKRMKLCHHSPILNTLAQNERTFSALLNKLPVNKTRLAVEKMCKSNMAVRLTECFYVFIYIPLLYTNNKYVDVSVCVSSLYDALFSHLKSEEKFRRAKLRDRPLDINTESVFSKILTNTRTYAGTLRSYAYRTNERTDRRKIKKDDNIVIDVQIPIVMILDTFIQFAKITPVVSIELLLQLLDCTKGNEFDSRPMLAHMLSKLVTAYPIMIELCRRVIDEISAIDGIKETISKCNQLLFDTEAEDVTKLLNEEVLLRTEREQLFVMGVNDVLQMDVSLSSDDEIFSIEDLVSTFKKLSNWDCLTSREKRRVEMTKIPPLWAGGETFTQMLDNYTETKTWFGKMVELYKNNKHDCVKWVKQIDLYPRRHFESSAITEAIQWHDSECSIDNIQIPLNMKNCDCIAEWAARLMIRSAYLTNVSDGDTVKLSLSRSHERLWCERATEMALPGLALQCVKERTADLNDDETLPWLEQKVLALRKMGLMQNDSEMLRVALDKAERYSEMFYNQSTPVSILSINSLMLLINYDLESLNTSKIVKYYDEITTQYQRLDKSISTNKIKRTMTSVHNCIMYYYEDIINKENHNDCLNQMLVTSQRACNVTTDTHASYIAIILNNINFDLVDDDTYTKLITLIQASIKSLPAQYTAQIQAKLRKSNTRMFPWECEDVKKSMKCLQLVCDPQYTLMLYCTDLDKALNDGDETEWRNTFNRMCEVFFENEFIGNDFMTLLKYKRKLYSIRKYDSTCIQSSRSVLRDIIVELQSPRALQCRRVTSLCPALTDTQTLRAALAVDVCGVDEEIKVYTDSVSRPCVLTVLLTDGTKRKFIIKRERLKHAAAAECVAALIPSIATECTITPISDDCSIINYLEDHIRLREMISSVFNLEDIQVVRQSRKDDELILSPMQSSLSHHQAMCNSIPSYSLRNAIEMKCASTQEFILKKRNFEESLASVTIVSWMYGLGDRHLNNILYSPRDGAVQCIDWGAIFQYGGVELPPARLTRNLLAVCDIKAFESKLQNKMASIRSNQREYLPILRLSFENTDRADENLPYIENIIKGSVTSHEIAKQILMKSNKLYKEKYVQLLDNIFEDFIEKDLYSVEEQVSSFLRQSTDPRILSVTRTGWEPWL